MIQVNILVGTKRVKTEIKVRLTEDGRVLVSKTNPLAHAPTGGEHVDITEDGTYEIDGMTFEVKDALKKTVKKVGEFFIVSDVTVVKPGTFMIKHGLLDKESVYLYEDGILKPVVPFIK